MEDLRDWSLWRARESMSPQVPLISRSARAGLGRSAEVQVSQACRGFEQWRALSTRIEGLLRVGDTFTSMYESAGRNDRFNMIGKVFLPELTAIDAELEQFKTAWEIGVASRARTL